MQPVSFAYVLGYPFEYFGINKEPIQLLLLQRNMPGAEAFARLFESLVDPEAFGIARWTLENPSTAQELQVQCKTTSAMPMLVLCRVTLTHNSLSIRRYRLDRRLHR
jgi:hypothetical protein